MTCEKLREIAFNSHVPCYIVGGKGICNIIVSLKNPAGLVKVYEFEDFLSISALKQVRTLNVTLCNTIYM